MLKTYSFLQVASEALTGGQLADRSKNSPHPVFGQTRTRVIEMKAFREFLFPAPLGETAKQFVVAYLWPLWAAGVH